MVVFPAFHCTRLLIRVRDQKTTRAAPPSGCFEDCYPSIDESDEFPQVARDELLTLRYERDAASPRHFVNPPGVSVEIAEYGHTQSAPFYEPLFAALESAGWVRNRSIRVAGYDSRLTPDQGRFAVHTKTLIETTYHDSGDVPVHLVGHSNGPLYAHYLLTQSEQAWKDRYIHGITIIAGNFGGGGIIYPILFTGFNTRSYAFPRTADNAHSSARMFQSCPSSYMSAADPSIFGDEEVVVEDALGGGTYTPRDYRQLLLDAGLTDAATLADEYIGFTRFTTKDSFPNVHVHAEVGTGIATPVGMQLADLSLGQLVTSATAFHERDGDGSHEDITNNATRAWEAMPEHEFRLTENPGVEHFALASDPYVISRLVTEISGPPGR